MEAMLSVDQGEDCIDVAPDARHYLEPLNRDNGVELKYATVKTERRERSML